MFNEVNQFLLNSVYYCPYDGNASCKEVGDLDVRNRSLVEHFLKHRNCNYCERKSRYMYQDRGDLEIRSCNVEPKNKCTMDYARRMLVLKRDSVLRINEGRFDVFHQLVVAVGGTGMYRTDNAAFLDVYPIFLTLSEPITVYRSDVLGRATLQTVDFVARVLPRSDVKNGYYRMVQFIQRRIMELGGDARCMCFEDLALNHEQADARNLAELEYYLNKNF